MTEPTTEPGKWLVAEYARTPGDPKWYPGLGLESTVIAIEAEARLLNVDQLSYAIYAVSLTHGSYDWDWVLEDGVAAAIVRAYEAKP